MLDGSITRLGSQYVLGFARRTAAPAEVLAEEQVQAARKEDVLNALSQIASRFRARVGESLATVEKYDTPLAEATTPSLEALKAYSTGLKVLSSTGEAAAVPFFKRAIEIDPKFATAYARSGSCTAMWRIRPFCESTSKAYQLRDRASDEEKFFITASYDTRDGKPRKGAADLRVVDANLSSRIDAPRFSGRDVPCPRQLREVGR